MPLPLWRRRTGRWRRTAIRSPRRRLPACCVASLLPFPSQLSTSPLHADHHGRRRRGRRGAQPPQRSTAATAVKKKPRESKRRCRRRKQNKNKAASTDVDAARDAGPDDSAAEQKPASWRPTGGAISPLPGIDMFVVEDRGGDMVVSLLFLGTWPALLTLLQRRGRLPQHTSLDYCVTNLLAAAVIASHLGSLEGPGLVCQASSLSSLSIRNLISQYVWAFVGLFVTNIICSSLAVIVGTTMNYFLDGQINRAEILFPGVACFLIAIGFAFHSSNAKDEEMKLSMSGFRNASEHYQSEFL